MAKTRLQVAKKDIEALFSSLQSKVLRLADIARILDENRAGWRLARTLSVRAFVEFVLHQSQLKRIAMHFPSRTETRYAWKDIPLYSVALSLRPKSYFTHYTAMYLHHLTDQVPRTIYVNSEQPAKPSGESGLIQSRIDMAFRSRPRTSRTVAEIGDQRICLLNGMHTGQLGVVDLPAPDGSAARATGLERTLIDVAVRPFYAGGVSQVLKAYEVAGGRASVNRMAAYLKALKYIYPYHQAIGFYLERSGAYDKEAVALMEQFPMNYDFYLTHQIGQKDHSDRWRLYFPKGL